MIEPMIEIHIDIPPYPDEHLFTGQIEAASLAMFAQSVEQAEGARLMIAWVKLGHEARMAWRNKAHAVLSGCPGLLLRPEQDPWYQKPSLRIGGS